MIAEGNAEGNAAVQKAIDGLIAQSKTVERVIAALDLGQIELEGPTVSTIERRLPISTWPAAPASPCAVGGGRAAFLHRPAAALPACPQGRIARMIAFRVSRPSLPIAAALLAAGAAALSGYGLSPKTLLPVSTGMVETAPVLRDDLTPTERARVGRRDPGCGTGSTGRSLSRPWRAAARRPPPAGTRQSVPADPHT